MKHNVPMKILKVLVIVTVACAAFGFIVMNLWNALIPELFHGPLLTFWQAVGLLVLSHILLRGWSPWRHFGGWKHDHWRNRLESKMASMTPEEKERFKQEWQGLCGWGEKHDHH